MRITSSAVTLASQHTLTERSEQRESFRFWVGGSAGNSAHGAGRDRLQLSHHARHNSEAQPRQAASADAATKTDGKDNLPPRLQLMARVLQAISGHEIEVMDARTAATVQGEAGSTAATPAPAATTTQPTPQQGWGLVYEARVTQVQEEQTGFSAAGTVTTADGRQIDFRLGLAMSRTTTTEAQVSLRAGDAALTDPLVLSFGGGAVDLSGPAASFDLNGDGQLENIASVGGSSGLLGLDRNHDGQVNDGSELFGPQTGDGFAELAAYDGDGNRWIDAGDAVFNDLVVWTKTADGGDQVTPLSAAGVGAIYLGDVRTDFSLVGASGAAQGQLRSTGVFLTEDGQVGTVQQVDLATQPAAVEAT